MAVNPITSDSLTLDFKSLMKVPVGDRVKAAAYDQAFLQSILTALTPIQVAQAFPDYFRRQLPDVSNFITANIVARNGGRFDQTGGGAGGSSYPYYDSETKPSGKRPAGISQPSIEDMKKSLLKSGINVDNVYDVVSQTAVLQGDKRIDVLKKLSDEELKKAGFQRTQDENGKTLIQMASSVYEGMSEAQILDQYKKEFPKSNISPRERATLDLIAKREGSKDPNTIFGGERYVERLGLDKKPLTERTISEVINDIMPRLRELSKDDGYGINERGELKGTSAVGSGQMIEGTLIANLRALGIPEEDWGKIKFDKNLQERLTLMNFKTSGIGDPNEDPSTWNQSRLGAQYESFNTSRGHAPLTGEEAMQVREKSSIRPENKEDVSAQEALTKLKEAESIGYNEELIRRLYNQASPTSSEYIQDPNDPRTSTVLDSRVAEEQAGFRKLPIKPELKNSLDYAAEMSGIEVEVFSGGQDHQIHDQMEAAGHESSYRHNIDIPGTPGAADVVLYYRDENGKKIPLSVTNPEHSAKIAAFTENFTRVVPSAGVGSNYMKSGGIIDPTKIHYGGPNKPGDSATTWGNMPDYMREAHQRGVAQRNEDVKNDRDPLREWIIKKEEQRRKQEEQVADNSANLSTSTDSENAPVPQKALGGNIYGVNEDITLVNTETGTPIAQVNNDEKLIKQGSELQVTSESKIKAEELGQQLDTSEDEEPVPQEQQNANQARQVNRQQPVNNDSDKMWRQTVAERQREDSPSYARAMTRTKFGREGNHFNRAAPGSIS